jgi:CRP/FNR family transcriptional regulator
MSTELSAARIGWLQEDVSPPHGRDEQPGMLRELFPSLAYPANTELFQQGQKPQEVYFIEKGLIKLLRIEDNGGALIVSLRFPGWLMCSPAIIKHPYPVTGVAVTRCQLRRIPASVFEEAIRTDPVLSWSIHQEQSKEIVNNVFQAGQLACLPARHRLEQLIWRLASTQNSQLKSVARLQMPLKQWEVAEVISVTPTYLSRLLKELESAGLIERRAGYLIIPDPERLWHEGGAGCL